VPSIGNELIQLLPRKDRTRLLAICEPIELSMKQVVFESGVVARHVYFPTTGFVSLVTPIDGKPVLEVGMVGSEGMLGTHLALGIRTTPLHALVQGAGSAWRVAAAPFRVELARSTALRRNLNGYIHVTMLQLASMAACLRFHQISDRLARWLLMTQDRAHAQRFYVTHEFVAYMLGVRRVGITTAAATLQRRGLIEYHRGQLTVLDRKGLEAAACSCYGTDQKSYHHFLH
jgi:CRP-like cAMP-binding protein